MTIVDTGAVSKSAGQKPSCIGKSEAAKAVSGNQPALIPIPDKRCPKIIPKCRLKDRGKILGQRSIMEWLGTVTSNPKQPNLKHTPILGKKRTTPTKRKSSTRQPRTMSTPTQPPTLSPPHKRCNSNPHGMQTTSRIHLASRNRPQLWLALA